jgi:hypothetical protein
MRVVSQNVAVYSYKQFRQVTGLSKKEADSWVQKGIVTANRFADGRRNTYTLDSMVEGEVAKQLADFASRELLVQMMKQLRNCLAYEKVSYDGISVDLKQPHFLVRIHTQKSKEILPGGGVRGIVAVVRRYEPSSEGIQKSVFVVVDLTLTMLLVRAAIAKTLQE